MPGAASRQRDLDERAQAARAEIGGGLEQAPVHVLERHEDRQCHERHPGVEQHEQHRELRVEQPVDLVALRAQPGVEEERC